MSTARDAEGGRYYRVKDRVTGELLTQRFDDYAEAVDFKRILCEQSSWIRYEVVEANRATLH